MVITDGERDAGVFRVGRWRRRRIDYSWSSSGRVLGGQAKDTLLFGQ